MSRLPQRPPQTCHTCGSPMRVVLQAADVRGLSWKRWECPVNPAHPVTMELGPSRHRLLELSPRHPNRARPIPPRPPRQRRTPR